MLVSQQLNIITICAIVELLKNLLHAFIILSDDMNVQTECKC